MRYASAVIDRLSIGRGVSQALRFTDVSSRRSGTPNAFVMRLSLLVVSTFCGSSTPPTGTNCVVTLLYHARWSDGARKPVLAAARGAVARAPSRRGAGLAV